ncbi:MAG: carboxypeptidase-like regulatory domain-containing protein, partial [Draconibacterium sp.]|nr:carboxypeptidase-like regulatory domain-containing protein [Draconibacterium sp.]
MRYILFLFLSILAFSLSGQEVSDILVNYSKKDATLEQIFKDLEAQYGIRFSYATAAIESKRMDADFENESIQEVLDYLLDQESLEYKIVANNILLRKSESYKEMGDDNYKSSLHLKGKITNSHDSKEALDYASISISNSSIGTYSDEEGRFDIEIPQQDLDENIIIHYLGYEDEIYKISELEDEYILVALKDGQFSIEEVIIVNKEKPLNLGNASNNIELNMTQIKSNTSGVMGNDIGRQIQLLPGISAHDDDSAAIKIRGSNSDETLMILDGMPIYNANHYYGIFSGVNTAYIDSVNLFKNTYPLQYGGKTAGLVELFSDKAQPASTKVNLNLDFLTASGDVRIPISEKSHFSFAGRSTLKEVNNKQFNTIKSSTQNDIQVQSFSQKVDDRRNDPSFTFYDMNAKYQYRNAN